MNLDNINIEELKEEITAIVEGKKIIKKNEISINFNKMPKKELDSVIEKSILLNDLETLKAINKSSSSSLYKCRIGKDKENVIFFTLKNQNPVVYEYFLTLNNLNSLMLVHGAVELLIEKDSPELLKIFRARNKDFVFFDKSIKNNILEYIFENEELFQNENINALKNRVVNGLTSSMTNDSLNLCLKFFKNKIDKKKISENVLLSDNVELLKTLLKNNMFDFKSSFGTGSFIDFLIEKTAWNMFNVFYKSDFYKDDFILKLNNVKLNKFFVSNSTSISNLKKLIKVIFKDNWINQNDSVCFMNFNIESYSSLQKKPLNMMKIILDNEKLLFPYYVNMNKDNLKKFESKLYYSGEELNIYKSKVEKYKILSNTQANSNKEENNDSNMKQRRL